MAKLFFEIIPSNTNFDFMKNRWWFMGASIAAVVISLVSLLTRGLNYGVDFQGGTQVEVQFVAKPPAGEIRSALTKIDLADAMVQEEGGKGSGRFLIRVATAEIDLNKHAVTLKTALAGGALRFAEDRMYVKYGQAKNPDEIAAAINATGVEEIRVAGVSLFGRASENEYMVIFAGVAARILRQFEDSFGKGSFEILATEQVGPKVGKELQLQAVGAILISFVLILIYVWFRFEFTFAPGAVLCLFHDSMIILGVFSLFQFPFDLSVVAAILTIVGFSCNDTIVIYDRIRENLQKTRDPDLGKVMNEAINQTLSRTILTSGTVLLASLALVFMGGPITFYFSLAFTIGVIVGSYSTIGVASALTLLLHNRLLRRAA